MEESGDRCRMGRQFLHCWSTCKLRSDLIDLGRGTLSCSFKLFYWNENIIGIFLFCIYELTHTGKLRCPLVCCYGCSLPRDKLRGGWVCARGLWWNRSGVTLSGRLFPPVCICSWSPSHDTRLRILLPYTQWEWAEGERVPYDSPVCLVHNYNPCIFQGCGLQQRLVIIEVNGTFQGPYFCVNYMVWQQGKRWEMRIL